MIELQGKIDKSIYSNLVKVFDIVKNAFSLPENVKVNLNFVTENKIKQLNKKTRKIDAVTDVLTYPYVNLTPKKRLKISDYALDVDPADNTLTIGDIYICLPRAIEQAKAYNHTLNREVCFLFCHGLLHILGYDHILPEDAKLMEQKQDEILLNADILRDFRSGFVTIVGETNSGKSTLINQLVGQKVSITSPKSQTTRENILGIYNDANSQIVFVDTPGVHKQNYKIDKEMDKQIVDAQADTELVLLMLVAKKDLLTQYNNLIKKVPPKSKIILLINKIDEAGYEKLYPQLSKISALPVLEILPISALKGKNCDVLIDMIKKYLPSYDYSMRYFPEDEYTNKNLRFMVAEIVREKALYNLEDEIPHGIHVEVTEFLENSTPIQISADVYCEKENHKAIILGRSGNMIKKISTDSRLEIEKLIGKKINLSLFVKVKPNWRNDSRAIENFGLNFSE